MYTIHHHLSNAFIKTSGPTRENNVHRPTNNFSGPGSSQNNQPLNNGIYKLNYIIIF